MGSSWYQGPGESDTSTGPPAGTRVQLEELGIGSLGVQRKRRAAVTRTESPMRHRNGQSVLELVSAQDGTRMQEDCPLRVVIIKEETSLLGCISPGLQPDRPGRIICMISSAGNSSLSGHSTSHDALELEVLVALCLAEPSWRDLCFHGWKTWNMEQEH
jgi:hypothetical protein